jgi:phosphoribosyl-ATP pyrophosphohydrolase/phosphoribosyl-AMP cyclohydrolase
MGRGPAPEPGVSAPAADAVRFDAAGLVPAVIQDADTGDVLMVAWMNAEALARTRATGLAHFWSRSRAALWQKGETSGHRQHVEAIYADCDGDTLLVRVHPAGPACHTGRRTCFFTRVDRPAAMAPASDPGAEAPAGILDRVERVIQARRAAPQEGSYVSRLLADGEPRLARKVGEEAAEVIVAALAEGSDRLVAEVADLWFHTLVLLGARGLSARAVLAELARRHRPADGPVG